MPLLEVDVREVLFLSDEFDLLAAVRDEELLLWVALTFELLLVLELLLLPETACCLELVVVELFTAPLVLLLEVGVLVLPEFTFPLFLWVALLEFLSTFPVLLRVDCCSLERFTVPLLLLRVVCCSDERFTVPLLLLLRVGCSSEERFTVLLVRLF